MDTSTHKDQEELPHLSNITQDGGLKKRIIRPAFDENAAQPLDGSQVEGKWSYYCI